MKSQKYFYKTFITYKIAVRFPSEFLNVHSQFLNLSCGPVTNSLHSDSLCRPLFE